MLKKLFSRILRFFIRITVCGLGCMMLAAAAMTIAAPAQTLTQAAKANFSPPVQLILQSGACILIAAGGFSIRRIGRSPRLKLRSKYLLLWSGI